MSNSIEDTPSKNPTELLQDQVILLRNIYEILPNNAGCDARKSFRDLRNQ